MAQLLPIVEKVCTLAFLICSMLAMGLTLAPGAILAPLRNARLVLLALALNFVVAPALAWALTSIIPLQQGHAIGLLLLGGAAGAPFLPKLIEVARGDFALGAALTGLLTVGTILFLPFALPLLVPGFQAEPWAIARPLVLLILLPLIAGMLINGRASSFATRASPIFAKIGAASMLVLFALLIAVNFRALIDVIGSGAIFVGLLYFLGMFILSWVLSGADREARGVLSLATAARNFGAALIPATASSNDPQVTIMIIVSAIVCVLVTMIAARWVGNRTSESQPQR